MGADKELTPRAVFEISLNEIATRTIDLDNILGSNTVASHTMKVYNSSDTDVTSTIGEGSSESSGTLTFGINGATAGTYTIVFWITCDQETPDETAIKFPVEVVLIVTDSATEATSTAAETLVSYALITLNDLKASLNIAFSNTEYDNALVLMINEATATIESMCGGRRFAQTTHTTETHSGDGSKNLWVANPPIISVSAVTIDNETVSEATDYDDYDGYRIEPLVKGCKMPGLLYRSDGWDEGDQNIEVTYSGGYATIPYDIRRAAIMICRGWYDLYRYTETVGNYSFSFEGLILDRIKGKSLKNDISNLLAPYKIGIYG